jgi:hypothetical protein
MATIRGGKVKSIATLKSSMKKGGGGSQYLARVPADGTLTVRFLTEPTEWVTYFEHYDQVRKFYPCTDDCPGCTEGDRPSARYLSNALDVGETRVIPLVMPKSMAGSVLKKYEKYATLLDRDYELSRSGTGLDTEYDVTPEPPTKMNIDRFDLINLMEILEGQLEMADNSTSTSDDDDDDAPVAKTPAKKTAAKPSKAAADDDDDDDSDEDDDDLDEDSSDDDGGDDFWKREDLEGMSLKELRQAALDTGYTSADVRGLDSDAIMELLTTGDASSDEDSDDDDSDGSDDSDEELSEDDLRAMSLAEVKALAKEMGVRLKAGTSKDDIIDLILDAAAEGGDDEDDDDEEAPF